MERFCQGTRPVSFTIVTERLLVVGELFGGGDCVVARRALRGVAVVIAGRNPARNTKRGEASLRGDNLAAIVFSQTAVRVLVKESAVFVDTYGSIELVARELLHVRARWDVIAAIGAGFFQAPPRPSLFITMICDFQM